MRKYVRELGVLGLFVLSDRFFKINEKKKNNKDKKPKNIKKITTINKTLTKNQKNADEATDEEKKIYKKLINLNRYAFAIQFLNGAIQYYYVRRQVNKKNPPPYPIPLYEKGPLNQTRKEVETISVGTLMVLFSFLTALSHLSLVTSREDNYKTYIKNQINTQRWLEYSVTSSIMMFSYMGLSGVDNLEELIPLTVLVGVTNIFGLGIEKIKDPAFKDLRKILYYTATLTNGLPWAYLIYRVGPLLKFDIAGLNKRIEERILNNKLEKWKRENPPCNKNDYQKELDDATRKIYDEIATEDYKDEDSYKDSSRFIKSFKYIIIGLLVFLQALYYLFSLNMNQKYIKPMKNKRKLDPNEFYELERNYIYLSMVAKSLLSWTIWSGTLRPTSDEED